MDNIIYIGEKNFMSYVSSVVLQFTSKNEGEVILKARGKFITKAVDIAEVICKRFMVDQIKIVKILTNSEDFKNKEGKQIRVSTIEITMKK